MSPGASCSSRQGIGFLALEALFPKEKSRGIQQIVAMQNSIQLQGSSIKDSFSRKLWSLEKNKICPKVFSQDGLQDLGDPGIGARLSALLSSIEGDANLHSFGRFLTRQHLRGLLRTRVLLEQAWKQRHERLDPIRRPIFITGMPRSGSTFLHELMAQDANNRVPRVWEVMSPLPIGEESEGRRRFNTMACLWCFRRIAPNADKVHPLRADMPHECVAIQSYSLLSREFTIIFNVPGYETYLDSVDFDPAYLWQRRFLQHLQFGESAKQWILKAPDHVFTLPALLRVFPDAVVIQTHRNPLAVIKSSTKLLSVIRKTFAHPRDNREIGLNEAHALHEGLSRITQFREDHPTLADRFLDVHYDELVSNPIATVRRLYRDLDLSMNAATLERLRALVASRSRYSPHKAGATLMDFGVDPQVEAARFASYCTRFGIPQI